MGINNLAVQTFSSSGSQSVTRANKADNSKQITSDFISRPPMKYINGSGLSVIQGTFVRLPQSTTGATYPSETFNIPNNIDAISDMVLSMNLNMSTIGKYDGSGVYYSKTFLLDIINRIEIRMAGLIIQTIYPGDIYMRNYSELGTLISQENSFNIKRDASYVDTGSIIGHTTSSAETISFSLSIPFIGRSSDKDRSFLQTGSFTKNLAVTVFYNKIFDTTGNTLYVIPLLACSDASLNANIAVETRLTILSHIITDTEKNYIKQNIINRVINTSAGVVTRQIQERFIAASSARDTTAIDIDLDSIDLNVTHLLFCLNVDIFNQDGSTNVIQTPSQFIRFGDNTFIRPGQLKGVPQYVTGDNRLSSSWGKAYLDSNISDGSNSIMNPDVLGVFNGWLSSAELVLGNETTGQIPCSALYSSKVEFNLQNVDENFYVLKLADNAFSSAGVPFSRIKNKKLILNVRNRFFSTTSSTSFSPPSQSNFPYTPLGTIGSYIAGARRDATISVCACGTTLQIINNNTISFSYI